jgi:hypothetical protein
MIRAREPTKAGDARISVLAFFSAMVLCLLTLFSPFQAFSLLITLPLL